jgi:hypothetical protein
MGEFDGKQSIVRGDTIILWAICSKANLKKGVAMAGDPLSQPHRIFISESMILFFYGSLNLTCSNYISDEIAS